jgi:hypothetical protein
MGNLKLLDFWQWSQPDLLSNTARGVMAEFIVAAALELNIEEKLPQKVGMRMPMNFPQKPKDTPTVGRGSCTVNGFSTTISREEYDEPRGLLLFLHPHDTR